MTLKHCNKCNKDLSLDCFTKDKSKKSGIRSTCKQCSADAKAKHYIKNIDKEKARMRAYKKSKPEAQAARKKKHKEYVLNYLSNHPCEHCGQSDIRCLDFDHIDPETKKAGVSVLLASGHSLKMIKAEIKKCRVLCANCHRIHTSEYRDDYRNVYYNQNK